MAVTPQALALEAQLEAQLQTIENTHTRALVAAWAVAWAEISADLQDTLLELLADGTRVTRATMLRSVRLRAALATIHTSLRALAAEAGVVITADLDSIVDTAARTQDDIVAAMLPDTDEADALVDRAWTDSDQDALAQIVRRTTEQITSALQPLSDDAMRVVRRELIRGVAAGTSPRQTAARMVRRAEQGFNGGLTRALVIARTETLDAHRAAAAAGQARHTDVLATWVWLCHLGPGRLPCPACLARHGTEYPLSVAGPDDHQCGRCARMPKTKSWADLGFEGLDEPVDAVQDAREWFEALSEADQVQIMGRRRLALLRSGAVEWADLAQLVRTDGWRDSWHVTPVRVLAQSTRRARAAS